MTRIVSEILNAFHFDISEAGNFPTAESSKTEEIADIEGIQENNLFIDFHYNYVASRIVCFE